MFSCFHQLLKIDSAPETRERGVERALPTTALDFDSVMQQKTLYKHLELNK